MKTVLVLAWRNIWRNKSRSLALMLSVMLGMAAGLTLLGLMTGFIQQRFDNLIQNKVSHIQIHHKNYLLELDSKLTISQTNELNEFLDSLPVVTGHASRTLSFGMLASSHNSMGVKIMGISPNEERNITRFHDKLVEGEYLSSTVKNPVFISRKTAKKLKAKIGSKVVLTFQSSENDIISAAFRINGLYQTANTDFDENHVMVRREDLQQFVFASPEVNEIAILLTDETKAKETAKLIKDQFPDLDVKSWESLSPELRILLEQGGFMLYIFIIIILIGLAFGILNTMLMAVFERMQELGMLMAIGMNKQKIALMILMETIYLSIIGGIIGLFAGKLLVDGFEKRGLDLSRFADALAEFGYEAVVYPKVTWQDMQTILLLVFATSLLAAILPTLRAIYLNPVEAIRK